MAGLSFNFKTKKQMKNLFNSVKMTRPKNNVFDLSHDVKLSFNMGHLVPIMCLEAIPGDKFNISCESLLRFAPLVSPVMHRMDVTMHYYFVPNRILWPDWEKFITNSPAPPAFPTLNLNETTYTALADYLGLPIPIPAGSGGITEVISALPFAAYQAVFNEYYRDQNLQAPVDFHLVNGANDANSALTLLRRRAWEHDYFTSALPFAQKGAPVNLPLGTFNDVPVHSFPHLADTDLVINSANDTGIVEYQPSGDNKEIQIPLSPSDVPILDGSDLYAKTSDLVSEATTVNDLRRAFRLQEWLEKNARGGTRYIENILAHFGVKSSDKRLQRPEYITGTKSPVVISEIVNTTGTDDLPQGNMAGHGISVTAGKYGNYYCEEHGHIIGIMSCMPKTAYQQGIPKHFLKTSDPFQYFWPSFANIGEQEVLNKEVYAYGALGGDTFGYVPRYAEYKFQQSRVAGDFRTSLDFWHLGRIFASQPFLNEAFIQCTPDDRIFAVVDPTVQKLYAHVYNKVRAVRPMPKFGNPSF